MKPFNGASGHKARMFGLAIVGYLDSHNKNAFKSYQIRGELGLSRGQCSLGIRWLNNNGYIVRSGYCDNSCWRINNGH